MVDGPNTHDVAQESPSPPLRPRLSRYRRITLKASLSLLIGLFLIGPYLPDLVDTRSEWMRAQVYLWIALACIPGYFIVWSFLRLERWRKTRRTWRDR